MKFIIRAGKLANDIFNPVADYVYNTFGSNSGNLAYQYSVQKTLSTADSTFTPTYYKHDINKNKHLRDINSSYDALILPMANSLGRKDFISQLDELTTLIKSTKIPCIVTGIGLQSDTSGSFQVPGIDNAKQFIAAVLDKSNSIGVRGDITKKFLIKLGFPADRIDVIGCPSLYLHGSNFVLNKQIEVNSNSKVVYSFTPHMPKQLRMAMSKFLSLFNHIRYIAQRRDELAIMLFCGHNTLPKDDNLLITTPSSPLIVNNNARFFTHYPSWINYLKYFHFSVGTRLHGSITALLAGIPALLIVHDSRTKELGDYHGIPYIEAGHIHSEKDILDKLNNISFTKFNTSYKENFNNFISFLHKNSLRTIYDKEVGENRIFDSTFIEYTSQVIKPTIHENTETKIDILSSFNKIQSEYINKLKNK